MEFVEAGNLEGRDLQVFLEQLLKPYENQNLDSVVLGCTHYPFARRMIQQILGENIAIFDGGNGTAREMKRRLIAADLKNPSREKGTVIFENSYATEEEIALCRHLLEADV